MEKTKSCSQGARVDLAELLIRLDDDRELLRDLVIIFRDDFPRLSGALQQAVECQDMKNISILSHTLKGMLATLAVTRAASAAAQLEQMALAGVSAPVEEAFRAFELEVDGLLTEMETYVAVVRP
jgi:HPt (histidine-containing phosphotransfer) domain-containing protein